MATTRRVRWCVLLAVSLPLANAQAAFAQQRLTCVTIRVDETVPSVAKRITGDARNMRASWFQIVNPTTSRRVPKTRYGLLFAGWNACIVDLPGPEVGFRSVLSLAASLPTAPSAAVPPSHPVAPTLSASITWGSVAGWWAAVLFLCLAYWFVDAYLIKRRRVLWTMERFAERFVQEFERPLIQQQLPDRPIQSLVRFKPGRSRLDVLLAPQGGLRYPNLTDHKWNVTYDVLRVQEVLADPGFVSSQPYARGRWVVVPFQLRVDVREAGGQ